MLLFGGLFSLQSDKMDLYIENNDMNQNNPSMASLRIIQLINQTDSFNIEDDEGNLEEQTRTIVIPKNFESRLEEGNSSIKLIMDESHQTFPRTSSLINGVISSMNVEKQGVEQPIVLIQEQISSNDISFIEYFVPGVVGIAIMSTGIFGTIGTNTKYRKNGVIKKLATTPLSKFEWIIGLVLYHMLIGIISTSVILIVAVLVFNINVILNPVIIILIISGALTFPGLGMIISTVVREEEEADAAGNVVTFPMLFLSGTFFPLETMPTFIQAFARILPLTYLNNGLREIMVYGNYQAALWNCGIVFVIGIIAIAISMKVTRWTDL
uniref:ABC-type multidrug transport system, permease component (ABC-2.AB.P) n=1 Tax=uncultured marine thaumarchaeote KM3_54_F04 TaxID=1456191 RepID=A0A075H7S7_9ARCH|nr:ABC-type multidrug transport system, permease component (ABC-2.AB.P) [uncultured marine thaumarchaeote KM3_54_F04]